MNNRMNKLHNISYKLIIKILIDAQGFFISYLEKKSICFFKSHFSKTGIFNKKINNFYRIFFSKCLVKFIPEKSICQIQYYYAFL